MEIERIINENRKEVFTFWFYDTRRILYLDTYTVLERASSRHKVIGMDD